MTRVTILVWACTTSRDQRAWGGGLRYAVYGVILVMTSKEVIKLLKQAGWVHQRTNGSHHVFTHSVYLGIVVVPHPKSEMATGTLLSIEKQSHVKLRRSK